MSMQMTGYWGWLMTGLALIALEMVILPGSFLLFIGIAALLTGAAVAFLPLSWAAALVLFAVLSLASSVGGWRVYRMRRSYHTPDFLNDRAGTLVGKEFVLATGIAEGFGAIRVGDSVWRVSGPPLPSGARVRVTGMDGVTPIVVEAQ